MMKIEIIRGTKGTGMGIAALYIAMAMRRAMGNRVVFMAPELPSKSIFDEYRSLAPGYGWQADF